MEKVTEDTQIKTLTDETNGAIALFDDYEYESRNDYEFLIVFIKNGK